MMLFHDGDCYPEGEVSLKQLRFEYVARLHNAFPAIASSLLSYVERLRIAAVALGDLEILIAPNHRGTREYAVIEKALSAIRLPVPPQA